MTIPMDVLQRRILSVCILSFGCATFSGCSSTDAKPEQSIVKVPDLPEETILENAIGTYDEGLFKISLQSWSELRDGYPTSYYSTLAELKIADALFFSGDYPAALVSYEEFAKLHPGHEAMPYVRYQIGNCSFKQYRDIMHDQAPLQTALKSYELLIEQHPKSEYVVLARRQIDRSKELQAAYEAYVADFYTRKGLEQAANSRIKKLSTEFPGSKALQQLKEEKAAEGVPLTPAEKITAAGAQKAPSKPQIVPKNLFSESRYTEGLRSVVQLAKRPKEEVMIESALADSPPEAQPASSEQQEPVAGVPNVIDFTCDEEEDGTVFIATLRQPVREPSRNEDDNLQFAWASLGKSVAKTSILPQQLKCEADSTEVSIVSGQGGLTFELPEDAREEAGFIVLNRPSRVVLTIPD